MIKLFVIELTSHLRNEITKNRTGHAAGNFLSPLEAIKIALII